MNPLSRFRLADRGASVAEYALLVALISVVAIGAIKALGDSSSDGFTDAASGIGEDSEGAGPHPGPPPSVPDGGSGGGPGDDGGDLGGSGGSGGSGGTTTTTAPPATVPPTTTPAPTTSTTTPPASGSSGWSGAKATPNGNKWNSQATVKIFGTNGEPLTGVNAGVQIRVVQVYRTWDGKLAEQSWTDQATLVNGEATFSNNALARPADGTWHVVAMRYEVVNVVYYYPHNPTIGWDGGKPATTVLAP